MDENMKDRKVIVKNTENKIDKKWEKNNLLTDYYIQRNYRYMDNGDRNVLYNDYKLCSVSILTVVPFDMYDIICLMDFLLVSNP